MSRRLVALLPAVLLLVTLGSDPARAFQVYVANHSDNTVSVIDSVTNRVTASIATGRGPNGVSITPDGSKAYVSNDLDGTVSVIDTAAGKVLKTITTGGAPQPSAVSPDGGTVYVADHGGNGMDVIDTATDTLRTKATVAGAPVGLGIPPDSSFIFSIDRDTNTVIVLWPQSLALAARIPVGTTPLAIAFSPDGATAYVTNQGSGSVSVIDVPSSMVRGTIAVGRGPAGIAVTPDGTKIYTANSLDNSVSVIDAATNRVSATLQIPGGATAVAVTPDGRTAYVAGSAVTPITVATGTVGAEIQAGAAPDALAITPAPVALVAAVLPGERSVRYGETATVFATMVNATSGTLSNCRISLPLTTEPTDLSMSYQTTDPTTNALTGSPNTPVNIRGGGAQTFVLSFFCPTANVGAPVIDFDCDGVLRAAPVSGVNSVDLNFGVSPGPDIIALAATATGDGTVHLANGIGAFAIAASNAGTGSTLTVSTDTGGATLPVTAMLCRTNASGQCQGSPSPSVTADFAAGTAPTFSVFISASAAVPFAPGTSRLFVRFRDGYGASYGVTSVAVTTE